MPATERLLSDRVRGIEHSGIRRVWELAAERPNAVNLSIGQPDFPVPDAVKTPAADAIHHNRNGYTPTTGIPALRKRIAAHLEHDVAWRCQPGPDEPGLIVTSGTSGALVTAFLALLGPGDEAIIPDPYFVMYPVLGAISGGACVRCQTSPDFRMTAERVEPLITERTRLVLVNSPGNPSGVVLSEAEVNDLLDLCRTRGLVLISDEIYDEFTFRDGRTQPRSGDPDALACPSPCRAPRSWDTCLLVRGFGKTYGVTGWRLGFAAGPAWLIDAMAKIQQYTFVCPPTPLQHGALAAFDADMQHHVDEYQRRRDIAIEALRGVTDVVNPAGAFYVFPKVPERLGVSGTEFAEHLAQRDVLVIPGGVFSDRDTHIRLSLSAPTDRLGQGVELIADAMRG